MALRSCLFRALLARRPPAFTPSLPAFPLLRFPTTLPGRNTLPPGCLVDPFFTTSIRAFASVNKKSGSAVKRARQTEERRLRNRSRKSLIKTRIKKVFRTLDELKVSSSPSPEDIKPIDSLISKAQSAIDKAVKCGTLHKNTGARKKARLARRKTAVQIQLGLKNPATAT